jgi:hypothetical protein
VVPRSMPIILPMIFVSKSGILLKLVFKWCFAVSFQVAAGVSQEAGAGAWETITMAGRTSRPFSV